MESSAMTTSEVHPLLRYKRPLIFTRPGERLAGATRASIEMGCDALWIEGHGRVGKTFGGRQLVQTDAWRPFSMYMTEFTYSKRSEEHTSELQSLMRISYAVFCLQKKNINI